MLRLLQIIGTAVIPFILGVSAAAAQVKPIPIDELADSMRLHPKPALILISTDWCTYCQMQKAQLKKNKRFQAASTRFHFSEFDAETREPIAFNDTTYHFNATGVSSGTHELAHALGSTANGLVFPTWVVVNNKSEILFKHPGVLGPDALEALVEAVAKTTDEQ